MAILNREIRKNKLSCEQAIEENTPKANLTSAGTSAKELLSCCDKLRRFYHSKKKSYRNTKACFVKEGNLVIQFLSIFIVASILTPINSSQCSSKTGELD